MEDVQNTPETFLPLRSAAVRAGVPAAWLKAEAEAGRVPVLRAGRRLFFNPALLTQALLDRSSKGEAAHAG
jgi:hypothetical protein